MSLDEKQFKTEKKKQASSLRAQLELQWLAEKLEKERARARSKEVRNESFQLQKIREAVELERRQIQEEMQMAVLEKEMRQQLKIEQGREVIKNENQIRSQIKQQQIQQALERRNRLLKKKQEELEAKIYLKDYNTILRSQKRRELHERRASLSKQNGVRKQMSVAETQKSKFKESARTRKQSLKPRTKPKQLDEEEQEESEEEDSEEDEEEESATPSSTRTKSPVVSKTSSPSSTKSPKKVTPTKPEVSNYIKPTEQYLSGMQFASNAQELRRAANEAIVNFLKDEERAEQHRREFLAIITDQIERKKIEKTFDVERKKERNMLLQLNREVNNRIQQMYHQVSQ